MKLLSGSTRQSGVGKYMEAKRGHVNPTVERPRNRHNKKRPTPMRSRQMTSSEQRVLQPENPRPVCPTVVLVAQLVSRHSCAADRLPVVVRFPAGPRVRLKTVDPPKGNGLGQKHRPVCPTVSSFEH